MSMLDYTGDEVKDMTIVKRSARTPQKKSLFTIETFTVMDYSIYKKQVCLQKL